MLKLIHKILNVFVTIFSFLIFYVGTFYVHIFTAYTVYLSYGLFFGIIAFMCPILAEIIMFILFLIFYGLFNGYCITILIYLLSLGFVYLLAYLEDNIENRIK